MQPIVRRAAQSALVRKLHLELTAPIVALVLVLVALLFASGGCQQLKDIPLFNPESRLRNKIGSGYEVWGETNGQITEFVAKGWLKQADVNEHWAPPLDNAKLLLDEAEALRVAGDSAGSEGKVARAKTTLIFLRQQLETIRRGAK